MRELTFLGFLRDYVYYLSFARTTDLSKLGKEASKNNYRLREPLALYAIVSGKTDRLLCYVTNKELYAEYEGLSKMYNKNTIEAALKENPENFKYEYYKAWHSYECKKNMKAHELETKDRMREHILEYQKKRDIRTSEICKAVNASQSIFYAWLKHGDSCKVSMNTARAALRYTESVSAV